MDSLAVTMAYELSRFNIETSIVVPGAFTPGTEHFANAGKPADTGTAAAYARYDGLMDQVGSTCSGRSVFQLAHDPLAQKSKGLKGKGERDSAMRIALWS